MSQPEKPAPSRGTRPQLFSAAASTRPRSSRQPDFGPSILATIEGGQARSSAARDGLSLRRVLFMALVVLGAVALYLGVKFAVSPDAPAAASVVTAQAMTVSTPQATGEALTLASSQASSVAPPSTVAQGAASIENVPAPAASAPSVDATVAAVNSSGAPPAPPAQVEQVAPRERATQSASLQQRSVKRSTVTSRKAARKSPVENDDAELLAAMLPHLKRHDAAITSPAFERRCGQLSGDAAARCKDTFCNGREGSDAACPSPVDR